jgi:ATP phosphoribosyltransferase
MELTDSLIKDCEHLYEAKLLSKSSNESAFSCPAKNVGSFADWLVAQGATRVTSSKLDYIFSAENLLWSRLRMRLR